MDVIAIINSKDDHTSPIKHPIEVLGQVDILE